MRSLHEELRQASVLVAAVSAKQRNGAHVFMGRSGQFLGGLRWNDLRWNTSKLMPPGSDYLSLLGFLHCIVAILIFVTLLYIVGLVSDAQQFVELLQWSVFREDVHDKLWPPNVTNVLHFHLPVVLLTLLLVEVQPDTRTHTQPPHLTLLCWCWCTQMVTLWIMGRLRWSRVIQCLGSSFVFYWVLFAWAMASPTLQGVLAPAIPPASVEAATEAAAAAATAAATPAAAAVEAGLEAVAAGGAVAGEAIVATLSATTLHVRLLSSPALWMVVLLPPPAFLMIRLLSFPRFLPRGMSRGRASAAAQAVRVVLWLANAFIVAATTVTSCATLAALSNRAAMASLLAWHAPPAGGIDITATLPNNQA